MPAFDCHLDPELHSGYFRPCKSSYS